MGREGCALVLRVGSGELESPRESSRAPASRLASLGPSGCRLTPRDSIRLWGWSRSLRSGCRSAATDLYDTNEPRDGRVSITFALVEFGALVGRACRRNVLVARCPTATPRTAAERLRPQETDQERPAPWRAQRRQPVPRRLRKQTAARRVHGAPTRNRRRPRRPGAARRDHRGLLAVTARRPTKRARSNPDRRAAPAGVSESHPTHDGSGPARKQLLGGPRCPPWHAAHKASVTSPSATSGRPKAAAASNVGRAPRATSAPRRAPLPERPRVVQRRPAADDRAARLDLGARVEQRVDQLGVVARAAHISGVSPSPLGKRAFTSAPDSTSTASVSSRRGSPPGQST